MRRIGNAANDDVIGYILARDRGVDGALTLLERKYCQRVVRAGLNDEGVSIIRVIDRGARVGIDVLDDVGLAGIQVEGDNLRGQRTAPGKRNARAEQYKSQSRGSWLLVLKQHRGCFHY
jgi:hypothetical protein